jgi:flagellin
MKPWRFASNAGFDRHNNTGFDRFNKEKHQMALTIGTNSGALMAQAAASSVNKDMEIAMERLSTGKRINSAADDAAGVAIASRLSAEIKGTNQAIRNAMDGQALVDTAEGAHAEIENALQRMRELAVQAANDTNDADDRTALQAEFDALVTEIDRISANTTWAGQVLLNGAGSLGTVHTTADTTKAFKFHVSSENAGTTDTVTATISGMDATSLGVKGSDLVVTLGTEVEAGTGKITLLNDTTAGDTTFSTITVEIASASTDVLGFAIDGTNIAITNNATDSYAELVAGNAEQIKDAVQAKIDDGTLAGYTVSVAAAVVTVKKAGAISLSSNTNAQAAIEKIDTAIKDVNSQRGTLGALTNRLDSTVANLTNVSNNLAAGKGRIEDADFASETTNLAKAQILQQASTAMLAQANASKQNVLSLLQG